MTSLIFWVPYTAHHVYTERKREKQRIKNYERWEGLRDDYDEQRRTQSLDIQRTGGGWDNQYGDVPTGRGSIDSQNRPIFTLRDQQEANDARTGWRPQEVWDSQPRTQLQAQMTGHPSTYQNATFNGHTNGNPNAIPPYLHSQPTSTSSLPLRAQKTGSTWDEGLPARLAVQRRSFDEDEYAHRYRSANATPLSQSNVVSRQSSLSREGGRDSPATQSVGGAGAARTHTPSGLRSEYDQQQQQQRNRSPDVTQVIELPKNEFGFIEPARPTAPGGRMAELLERGY